MKQLFKISDGQFGKDLNRAALLFFCGILIYSCLWLVLYFYQGHSIMETYNLSIFLLSFMLLPAALLTISFTTKLARNICAILWPNKKSIGLLKLNGSDDYLWFSLVMIFYINAGFILLNLAGKEFFSVIFILWLLFSVFAREVEPLKSKTV